MVVSSCAKVATSLAVGCGYPATGDGRRADAAGGGGRDRGRMDKPKTYRFPVDVRWLEGKLTVATVPGKEPLEVATPPEFQGGHEGVWSPEDLFVGAVASCFTVTLISAARRRHVPLRGLEVRSFGDVSRRPDGRFGFVGVELVVELETEPGCEGEAKGAALDAEESCLVAVSLDTPVHAHVHVTAVPAAA